jgi:diguanylate cyclase (GGDEF)-like protein
MPDTPSLRDRLIAASSTLVRALPVAAKCLLAALAATALWWGVWMLLAGALMGESPATHLLAPTLILTMVWLLIYREYMKWWKPSRELREILEGCRERNRPIDDLRRVRGEMTPLAEMCTALLRELREQQRRTAELEAELHSRVVNRTSALERKMSSLRAQATRDALTGLYNRRMLEECLPKMIADCRTSGGELSVLAIDVDNFKPLNDTLGHAVGDEFLRSIAQILRSGVRECDAAIRSGGDEFIVLLPGCSLSAARALAERLATMVESLARTIKSPRPPGLSVGTAALSSIGHAKEDHEIIPALLEAADQQLYVRKTARKKRGAA